jgi:phosphoglycerate dehydrogenase-like enzyme
MRYKVALLLNRPMAESIFADADLSFLSKFADFNPVSSLPEKLTRERMAELLPGADACVTCWGTPSFTPELLAAAPGLKLIAHAAGSVKKLLPPEFWRTGCRVTSNSPVIAEEVAQTVLAFALTSEFRLWEYAADTRNGGWKSCQLKTRRLAGLKVGLVGLSNVCREVIKLFKFFGCEIVVYDPYASPFELADLGVAGASLTDLLSTCDIVSLHAPANEDCRHMINGGNLPLLKDGALFINTARGMLVDEDSLLKELRTGRIFACLDVTDPENPPPDHPFRTLPNVVLTPHIAGGATENGRKRLGANAISETYHYLTKGLLKYEVREEMLEHMA